LPGVLQLHIGAGDAAERRHGFDDEGNVRRRRAVVGAAPGEVLEAEQVPATTRQSNFGSMGTTYGLMAASRCCVHVAGVLADSCTDVVGEVIPALPWHHDANYRGGGWCINATAQAPDASAQQAPGPSRKRSSYGPLGTACACARTAA
jgi:hypothetical protein